MVTKDLVTTEHDNAEESLSHTAWQMLRSDIISGNLAPTTWLRIGHLREKYGIGASPLREALSRLVSEGFVISHERRGFLVAPMSLAEFRDLTNLRKMLEKESLKSSLQHGDDAWESEVLAAYYRLGKAQERLARDDEGSRQEWENRNLEFHEALVSACASPYTLRFRNMVYAYTERYRKVCLSIESVKRNVHEEHKELCDAALNRDIERLLEIIDKHLEATYHKVLESGRLQ